MIWYTNNADATPVPWTDITGDYPGAGTGLWDLVVDPVKNILYAAAGSGVYKCGTTSTPCPMNSSAHWTRWDTNLPAGGSQTPWRLRTWDGRPFGKPFEVFGGFWGSGIWMRDGSEP
jgi:hypothetical protein